MNFLSRFALGVKITISSCEPQQYLFTVCSSMQRSLKKSRNFIAIFHRTIDLLPAPTSPSGDELFELPFNLSLIPGALNKDSCPIEPFIPIYLIVAGSFGVLKMTCLVIQRVTSDGDIFYKNNDDAVTGNDDEGWRRINNDTTNVNDNNNKVRVYESIR